MSQNASPIKPYPMPKPADDETPDAPPEVDTEEARRRRPRADASPSAATGSEGTSTIVAQGYNNTPGSAGSGCAPRPSRAWASSTCDDTGAGWGDAGEPAELSSL